MSKQARLVYPLSEDETDMAEMGKPLSREEIEAEIKRLDMKIAGTRMAGFEPTPDSAKAVEHWRQQQENIWLTH